MKRYWAFLLLSSAVVLTACNPGKKATPLPPSSSDVSGPTTEQGAPPPPPPSEGGPAGADVRPRNGGGPGQMSVEQRVERMKENLGLSPDQADQIKSAFEAQRPAMEAIRNDQSLSREDRRVKMQALRQQMDAQLATILTPEQKAKWDEERAKRRAQMQGDRPGGEAPGAGNPPPAVGPGQ